MSAPPRNARGGGQPRGKAGTPAASRSRGRGSINNRGLRGRSGGTALPTNPRAAGLLQGLQSGSLYQRAGASRRGSGRPPTPGHQGRGQNAPVTSSTISHSKPPPPSSQRDYMNNMTTKFQQLKTKREAERTRAIRDGFLADPEKKTSLDKAITPVGTCTEMCPEFERVERIVQNMVDKAEKIPNEETGRDVPSEERMIKRFRRSAAGYDEQLPSDIRTPGTLQMTLDYLLDNVVGGEERLATVHKYVWDRTRGIRNDFSIQQVTKEEDVRIAVDCFERIARFHILSLHQLSNPENLVGEHFDAHQEREQLNNTLLSLMYYYDDHRSRQKFENEAEFRAYCIIFELQSQQPDLEDRMQSWPQELLKDPRIRIAFKLYSAAGNTLYDQGPLKPQAAFDIAQGNAVGFWKVLKSRAITYMMACVAEIYFGQVRFVALQGLWTSIKRAPASMQAKVQDWTLEELTKLLGFDDEEQALEFCSQYNLGFRSNDAGEQYLDFTSLAEMTLDKSSTPNQQVFSFGYVEGKRYHRTLVAVINGVRVAQAIREGLVVEQQEIDDEVDEDTEANDGNSLFVPETKRQDSQVDPRNPFLVLNPKAPAFTPAESSTQPLLAPSTPSGAANFTSFGKNTTAAPSFIPSESSKPPSTSIFGSDTPVRTSFTPQSISQPVSHLFPSAAPKSDSSATSFGLPSFSPAAPSSAKPSTAPTTTKNLWPSSTIDGAVSFDKLGNTPAFFPARVLDVKPLSDSPPLPLTDKTNANSTKPGSESASINKPPSSPRPGFKSLPPASQAEQAKPLFQEPSRSTESPTLEMQRGESAAAAKVSPDAQSVAIEPRAASNNLALNASSVPANQTQSNDEGSQKGTNAAQQPFVKKTQTTPQQVLPRTVNISPSTTTKSAIPPTFTPNASPSFTSPTNTKPKHKSPLGSQPPIFAADSGSKYSSTHHSAADLEKAAHNLATIGFLEPHGILQQYIEHTATTAIEEALRQFEREEPLRAAQSARHELLSRKYFKRWNSIYWRKKLNRNATSRRQSLAQSIRRESQRRTRGDAELEAILEAQKQKVRIQAEQLRRSQEDPNPQVPVSEVGQRPKSLLLAGRKRKSLHGDELHPITNGNGGRKVAKRHAHRRSKTMDGLRSISKANSPAQVDAAPASPRMKSSTLSGVSILQDRNASSIPLQFTRGRKTDSTHTDYFRLKALGIDPDTPIFPDTKNSLDRKRRRQEELSQPTPKKRASTLSSPNAHKSDQHELSSTSQTQASRSITAPETSLPDPRTTQQESKDDLLEDDDEFLRQIREIQAAMSEDTEWFQRHAALIEKGVEQQEEFRESLSQRSSTNSSAVATPNSKTGLARVNGYDYAPFTSRSGSQFSLSRTEKRIRVTGARGLATKSVSDYLAVPMSKSSRAALQELDKVHDDREPNPPKKRKAKTKQGEKDSKYIYESDEEDKEEALEMEMSSHVHNHKQQHLSKRRIETYKSHLQADNEGDENGWDRDYHIDTLHQVTVNHDTSSAFDEEVYDEEEEDVSGEGIEEDEEYIQEGLDGEGDEGDDGEDEAEYDEDDDSVLNENHLVEAGSTTLPSLRGSKINPFHMRLRSATPEAQASSGGEYALGGTQMSRATSGTGVSADDALVLSD